MWQINHKFSIKLQKNQLKELLELIKINKDLKLLSSFLYYQVLKEKYRYQIYQTIDDDKAAVLKVQLYWEYQTINRGKSSILQVLLSKGIKNPFEYIEFFSLRQHSQSPNPVTEIIYIHSKLMIVDDKVALIGSANINDRSLNGSRDSELAIIVQDQIKIETQMNGQPFQSAKFAHTLRCQLYMEHFGLNQNQVLDPLSMDLENEIRKRTTLNTQIYREIFACYPDDTVTSVKEYKAFAKKKNLSKYKELIPQIQGHAVQFPLNFLSKEKLSPKIYSLIIYFNDTMQSIVIYKDILFK